MNIRAEVERWFERYPTDEQAELRARFRDRRQHISAWPELYLHRLFTLLGFDVVVHPELDVVTTRPDSRETGSTGELLLEAATTEAGTAEPGRDGTREGWIIDALNASPHPNFFVALRFRLVGQQRPRNSEVTGPVTAWLDSVSADEVLETGDLPEHEFEFRDWRIVLRAILKSPQWRGVCEGDPLVGMGPATGGFVNDRERMLAKLRDKSGKYGAPELPIVVAVICRRASAMRAQWSRPCSAAWQSGCRLAGMSRRLRRSDSKTGTWMRDGQPPATRVSAVLSGPGLTPWTIVNKCRRSGSTRGPPHPLDINMPLPRRIGDETGRVDYVEAETNTRSGIQTAEDWPGAIS